MFYRHFLSKHPGLSSLQYHSTSNKCHKQQSLFWAPKLSNCLQHSPNTWVFCYFSSFIKLDNCSAVSPRNVLFQSATSEARQRQVRFSSWVDFADLLCTSGKRLRDSVVVIKIYLGRRSLGAVSLFWMKCSHEVRQGCSVSTPSRSISAPVGLWFPRFPSFAPQCSQFPPLQLQKGWLAPWPPMGTAASASLCAMAYKK